MRVFMLGWEFPPFISGGLGTACYGLTKALSRQQTNITFVLPKSVGGEYSSHVRLLSPQAPASQQGQGSQSPREVASTYCYEPGVGDPGEFANVTFKAVPSRFSSPYASGGTSVASTGQTRGSSQQYRMAQGVAGVNMAGTRQDESIGSGQTAEGDYGGDLIGEAQRYAHLCLNLARDKQFDVIHAHDWLTFPAGMAIARASGKPLVVHVHSTEFDRAGENINQQVYDIERRGMHAALRVVAVSHLTRRIIESRYGVVSSKIDVIYNGIENERMIDVPAARPTAIKKTDKIVVFLGRITMQKGPEYFVAAAKKVLEKIDDVKFVMAGVGDKSRDVIELAARQGIGHKILFTGFLRGRDVDRVFHMADVYVMPSVSEPFGIAALEAIRHDVPVILSKTSGVSEVLAHALKVDFWDTDQIADRIIAVLSHPPLASTLRQHADIEVRRLTWDDAAAKCRYVYDTAVAAMPS
jgi:glycogen(starch) synthase